MKLIDSDKLVDEMNDRAEEEYLEFRDLRNMVACAPEVKAIPIEEIEKAWESISDVAENGYVDMEEVKLWFAKWLDKELDE